MRKAVLLCILGANLSFIACTDDSLAEVQEKQNPSVYADGTGSEGGHIDPPAEPPGDGN